MDGERYTVVPSQGEGRSWFHVVDSWAPENEQPAVEYSFLTRAASDNAAQELNKTWTARERRRADAVEAKI